MTRIGLVPLVQWAVTAAVLLVDGIWAASIGMSIALRSLSVPFAVALALGWLFYSRYRRKKRIAHTLHVTLRVVVFSNALAVLSYLVVTTDAPLVDDRLAAWDRLLGIDWVALFDWVQDHSWLRIALALAYDSMVPQVLFVLLFLGLSGRSVRADEFITAVMISSLLTVAVSGPLPASSAWIYYHLADRADVSQLSHFEPLRSGTLKLIDLARMQGLIQLPSLHTILAVLMAYAVRRTGLVYGLLTVLNLGLILSTPAIGGHYVIDTIAGLIIAPVVIVATRRLHRYAAAAGARGELESAKALVSPERSHG